MSLGKSVTDLGKLINAFLIHQTDITTVLGKKGTIERIHGPTVACEMYRRIVRNASNVMMLKSGMYSKYAMMTLKRKFGYEVVCLEDSPKGWLLAGIKTPLGIIVYEL